MKSICFGIGLIGVIFLTVNGCNNRTESLVGEWKMEWSFVNGVRDSESDTLTLFLEKDGIFRQVINSPIFKEELKGNWNYDKETNSISLHYTSSGASTIWQIVKFEYNNMDIRFTTRGFLVERRFNKRPN